MNPAATLPSSIQEVRSRLHEALAALPFRGECALLDYPDYPNIGDHMIWMGSAFYFAPHRNFRLVYASTAAGFSARRLPERAPILLQGGGNFGDLWYRHQEFREYIVARYRDRPIAILPQTVYFEDARKLKEAERVMNSHPDLTLFVRDRRSHETALKRFPRCRIVLAPDMSFELTDRLHLSGAPPGGAGTLYHCRTDPEQPQGVSPEHIGLGHAVMSDWISSRRSWRATRWEIAGPLAGVRATARYLRGMLDQPGLRYRERLSLRAWQGLLDAGSLPQAPLHRRSWASIHAGAWQFSQFSSIVTNRLHGHILCLLLGIPHVLLPNSYFKNEAFHRAWTRGLPKCRFSTDPSRAHECEAALRPS